MDERVHFLALAGRGENGGALSRVRYLSQDRLQIFDRYKERPCRRYAGRGFVELREFGWIWRRARMR